ncbi:MAG TPA: hypothetical protein PKD26_07735 [Pyrinomonadaceae bacterium]|nr:hypothetical protein [Pyrinomonadaceae bacterium]
MRHISETKAIGLLSKIRSRFSSVIRKYEKLAKKCEDCLTPGACCLDQHFVNVRITRIEAEAILREIDSLDGERKRAVMARTRRAIRDFGLENVSEDSVRSYACPLFEKEVGCLVHAAAKPLPCIAHACYERKVDLPPETLLIEAETEIAKLNTLTYGHTQLPVPLPVAIFAREKPNTL